MRYTRTVLDNGLRVITAPSRDAHTVTVIVFVAAGSKYETKKINGISHFLEHLCFKGTEELPTPLSVSESFDSLGAENNAFTAEEYTGYYAKADSKHFGKILKLVADIYLHATLPEPEIEKEKGVVIEEINLYNDKPTYHAEDLITDLLYGDQPAGWEVLGTKENIRRFSREEIAQYRKEHYVARGTTVVVAGNVTSRAATSEIKKAFSYISTGAKSKKKGVIEKQKKPRVGVRYRKTDQAHMVIGSRSVPFGHKDMPALTLLGTILGGGMSSRLFTRLRDELGLCYYVSAGNRFFTDHGYFAIRAGVTKRRVKEALSEILSLCKTVSEERVSHGELQKAKNYAVGSMYLGLETTDALAYSYGIQEILDIEVQSPAEWAKELRAVQPKDIQRVARKVFQDKNLNVAVAGPYKQTGYFTDVVHF